MSTINPDFSLNFPTDSEPLLYAALEKIAQTPTSIGASTLSSFSAADRKLIEELSAAASILPKPTLSLADYSLLMQKIFETDPISSMSKADTLSKCENSIILAVLSKWAENVAQLAEEGREEARKKALDPFRQALEDFTKSKEIPGMPGVVDMMMLLRSSPILLDSTKLQNIDAATLSAIYKKAEAIVMLDLINRFQTAGTAISSAINTATDKKTSAVNPAMQMFTQYINEIKKGTGPFNQTILSVMASGIFAGQNIQAGLVIDPKTNTVSIDPTASSLLPMNQVLQALNTLVPQAVQGTLSGNVTSSMVTIMNSFQRAATFQALTTAFSLMRQSISPHTLEHKPKEVSAKAYAFKLEQMIVSPECETFMRTLLSLNPTLSKLSPEQLQTATIISRALLLTNALAALDKNATGGIVIRKEDIKGFLNGSIQIAPDDMRAALVTLIRKELTDLDPTTRTQTLQMLFEYIDSNPDVSDLIDPIEDMVTSFDSFLSIKKQTAQEV